MSYFNAVDLFEGFGNVNDPLDVFSGQSSYQDYVYGGGSLYHSAISDFADGDNKPFWQTEQGHSEQRAQSRAIASAITMGYSVSENLENYTIGSGFEYKASSKMSVDGQELDGALSSLINADIEDFCERNEWNNGGLENEIHNRVRRDGEDFVALYDRGDGVEVRLINSEHFKQPHGLERDLEDQLRVGHFSSSWKYGVHCPEHDLQTELGYFSSWNESGTSWSYFPSKSWDAAKELGTGVMHHIKKNVDAKVKRGMSDYYPVARQLVDDAKLGRNMVSGAAAQAAIAYIEQFTEGFTAGQIEAYVKSQTDASTKVKTSTGASRDSYSQGSGGAKKLVMGYGKEFKPGPMSQGREQGFELVGAYGARRIGIRWCMPEFMISGDASNSNLASAIVTEGPFTKAREKDQRFFGKQFKKIIWKMLECLVRKGRYYKYGVRTINELKKRIKIIVGYPEVATRDRKEDAEANQIYNEMGVISRDTIRQKASLDPREEGKKVEHEREFDLQQGLTESQIQTVARATQMYLWDNWSY